MNYSVIKRHDIANGPGLRTSVFVSGCEHCCKGCFNEETWDFEFGQEFTKATIDYLEHLVGARECSGLSILGGEPLHPNNLSDVSHVIRHMKKMFPSKDVWLYTGYTMSELMKRVDVDTIKILELCDVIVDGRFVQELADPSLEYRGSSNQNIIMKSGGDENG